MRHDPLKVAVEAKYLSWDIAADPACMALLNRADGYALQAAEAIADPRWVDLLPSEVAARWDSMTLLEKVGEYVKTLEDTDP